jgi:hypothetical protein
VSVIRFNAPWIVACQEGEHRIVRDVCVVVDGNEVSYVGLLDSMALNPNYTKVCYWYHVTQ